MRILFADDSMTAQNMGKKILTDAGYEVVAVSNGAAAVKKIAEQKPDIIILDIYMPGYTGLEVCDKVRGSAETLKTPVLLTVGKMEPYRPEDANRVKADGVIIKPFEASDLLAVIKKLEEKVIPKSAPITEQTVRLERPPEFADLSVSENHHETVAYAREDTVQATVDVPDNMATAAAFSDLLGPEPNVTPHAAHAPALELPVVLEPAVEFEPMPEPPQHAPVVDEKVGVPEFTTLPSEDSALVSEPASTSEWDSTPTVSETTSGFDVDLGASTIPSGEPETSIESGKAQFAESDIVAFEPIAELKDDKRPASFADTQPIPVYKEPEVSESVSSFSVAEETLSAPQTVDEAPETGKVEFHSSVKPEPPVPFVAAAPPALEPEPSSSVEAESAKPVEFDSFSAKVEAQIQKIESIVSASEARYHEGEVKPPVESGLQHSTVTEKSAPPEEDDFEARVAAAMSAYDQTAEEAVESAPAPNNPNAKIKTAVAEEQTAEEPASLAAPYSFEYSPPVTTREPGPVEFTATEAQAPVEEVEASRPVEVSPVEFEAAAITQKVSPAAAESSVSSYHETVSASPAPVEEKHEETGVQDQAIVRELEAQLPDTSRAVANNSGSETQVIASVVSRVLERLKPHLIEEISRELKSKK